MFQDQTAFVKKTKTELEENHDYKNLPKCGKEKDISEFSWSIRGVKRHSRCMSCHAGERLEYYERNKEKELEYKWDRQQRKREEAKMFVEDYKRTHPCVDCGKSDPRFLT